MVIDGRTIASGTALETDVCIVGAGAAGITLAREFAGRDFRVTLLEAGGFELDPQTQALYGGENDGLPYHPLDACRLRFFGGTTNHWTGWCRPLDEADFTAREWVPWSGWPFERAVLEPYYARACSICQLQHDRFDVGGWTGRLPGTPLPLDPDTVETRVFQFSPPTPFGRVYRDEVTTAKNLRTVLHATVTGLEAAPDAGSIRSTRARTLAGNEFTVQARLFIIATGGIANAQLLLASRSVVSAGLGNQHDLVGRFFMEHPHHNGSARLLPVRRYAALPYYGQHAPDTRAMGVLFLSEQTRRRERLLSVNLSFHPRRHREVPGLTSLKTVARSVLRGNVPDSLRTHIGRMIRGLDDVPRGVRRRLERRPAYDYYVSWRSEQAPNPSSRVRLDAERDALGMPRVRLEWRLMEQDLRTIRRTQEIVAAEIGRAGVGRLRLPMDDGSHPWSAELTGGAHHMGTTRMARDPKRGVTDAYGRVHGIGNLYIAGSSLFPTVGSANPTLTIVALALRLAERIREQLK